MKKEKGQKVKFIVYIVVRVFVIAALIRQIWEHDWHDVFLYDTMQDLFVNFIGAVVFSIIGYIYIKNRGRGIAAEFIPTVDMAQLEEKKEEHQEELDHLLHEKLKLPKKNEADRRTDEPEQE